MHRIDAIKGVLAFLIAGILMALAMALVDWLPARHQLTAVGVAFAIAGAVAGAGLGSALFGTWRVRLIACSAAGLVLGGLYFTILTPAYAKSAELVLASGGGWAVGGLFVGAGVARWDRTAWLLVVGPIVFGVAGSVSWLVLDLFREPVLAFSGAYFVAVTLGGGLFAIAAGALRKRVY